MEPGENIMLRKLIRETIENMVAGDSPTPHNIKDIESALAHSYLMHISSDCDKYLEELRQLELKRTRTI